MKNNAIFLFVAVFYLSTVYCFCPFGCETPTPEPESGVFYAKILGGIDGLAAQKFALAAYTDLLEPPESLWLGQGKPYDEDVAPYTAPNPPYPKGSVIVDYVYTTNEYGPSKDIHVSGPYGGVPQIGEGIEGGPFEEEVDEWASECAGFDFDTLKRYHSMAEDCRPDCGPNRGRNGPMDIVHLWSYRQPYESLLNNMSEVFGVPLREDLHTPESLVVGDQTGIRRPDGWIERRSTLKDIERYARDHADRIHLSYESRITKIQIERDERDNLRAVGVHYSYKGESRYASLKDRIHDPRRCRRLGLDVSKGSCVRYGELYLGLGWLETVAVAKRSGLGPAQELIDLGIEPLVDLPLLGRFEGDVQGPTMVWGVTDPSLSGLEWNVFAAFKGDVQAPVIYVPRDFPPTSPVDLLVSPLYYASSAYEGYITLRASSSAGLTPVISADISLSPRIEAALRYSIDSFRELMGRNPGIFEILPGYSTLPSNYTTEQLRAYLLSDFNTQPHLMGSASCPDTVNPDGTWRGVRGLRSMGSMDFVKKMKGQPHWTVVAVAYKLGREAFRRWIDEMRNLDF